MENENENLVGLRIRAARKGAGLNQSQLAEKIGVTTNMVSRYEAEGADASFDRVRKIAEVTNRPFYWFFLEETGVRLDFSPDRHEEFWQRVRDIEVEDFAAPDAGVQVPTSSHYRHSNGLPIERTDDEESWHKLQVIGTYEEFEQSYSQGHAETMVRESQEYVNDLPMENPLDERPSLARLLIERLERLEERVEQMAVPSPVSARAAEGEKTSAIPGQKFGRLAENPSKDEGEAACDSPS